MFKVSEKTEKEISKVSQEIIDILCNGGELKAGIAILSLLKSVLMINQVARDFNKEPKTYDLFESKIFDLIDIVLWGITEPDGENNGT